MCVCVCARARVCSHNSHPAPDVKGRAATLQSDKTSPDRRQPHYATPDSTCTCVLGPYEMIISLLALLFEQRHSSYLKVKLRVRWTGCSSGLIVYFRPSPRISFEVVVGQHVDQSTIRSILLLLLLLLHYYYCYLLIAG